VKRGADHVYPLGFHLGGIPSSSEAMSIRTSIFCLGESSKKKTVKMAECANVVVCCAWPCAAPGLCAACDVAIGHALDIVETMEECPVCYEPMHHGVKWNADACRHRFCPACTHRMVFGKPQQTLRVDRDGVSRMSCPMCMRVMKPRHLKS